MRLVGRVPSNFGDHGDQVYLAPSNFCDCPSFLLSTVGSLNAPQDLNIKFNGGMKEE